MHHIFLIYKDIFVNITISLGLVIVFLFLQFQSGFAQSSGSFPSEKSKKWYDKLSIRGYAQVRYNRLFETNPLLRNEQGDKSWGGDGGLFIRRVRLVFSGQISKRVFFYFQPDFAGSFSSDNLNFGQLRDAYFDFGLDDDNEFRFRIGQSKIPFGFENMQSSSNRLPFDRADGMNSAFVNERDLGVFLYWAPKRIRNRFARLVKEGLKGSGDFGVFGIGFFNGQGANKPEANNNKHLVARISYPIMLGNQIIEPGIQGYTGKYKIMGNQLSEEMQLQANRNYRDERIAATFVLYPKPFGVQAEYNRGRGPAYNKVTDSIEVSKLNGGYVMFSYLQRIQDQVFLPFCRAHYYHGGKKHELDARMYDVKELEFGVEWQPLKQFELTCQYTLSSRRFEDYRDQNNLQKGNLLRIQAQVNF